MDSANVNSDHRLHVGDLDSAITLDELQKTFTKFTPVLEVKLVLPNNERGVYNRLCYAHINLPTHDDAKKAMKELNHKKLRGIPMYITWLSSSSTIRNSNVGNIFIKNLEKSITTKMLYNTFATFGRILSCSVALDTLGQSKGFGFVRFLKESSAEKAIKKVNGTLLKDVEVYVGKFIPRSERQTTDEVFNNIYVKNLPNEYTEEDLKNLFGILGEIESVKIGTHIDNNGDSLKFGFVCFQESECAKTAVEQFNEKEINNKVLRVSRAEKKIDREDRLRREYSALKTRRNPCNLYVNYLCPSITENQLITTFQKFGTIVSTKLMTNDDGSSRGCGFVCYSSEEEANSAIKEMHGKYLIDRHLYVSLALTKDELENTNICMKLRAKNEYFPQMTDLYSLPLIDNNGASNQSYILPRNELPEQYQRNAVKKTAPSKSR